MINSKKKKLEPPRGKQTLYRGMFLSNTTNIKGKRTNKQKKKKILQKI